MEPPRPEICVGAVVIADGRLLLIERGRGPATGQWSVPGGRVESGETLATAVEREVLEETGLVVTCGAFIGWVERIAGQHHYVIMDFHASLDRYRLAVSTGSAGFDGAEPVAGDDAAAAAWVPLGELGASDLVDGLASFLADHGII